MINGLHFELNRLDKGDARTCDNCMEIHSSKLFPYSSVNQCLTCYERLHGVQLKKFRNKSRLEETPSKIKTQKKKKEEAPFYREVSLETIHSYIEKQYSSSKPIKFYYRDDVSPREFKDFFIAENKYIKAMGNKGYPITFLIDKIRKVDIN